MIKALIFDCFGVLVGRGFEETYRLAGGDPVRDRDFINDILGQANLGLIDEEIFHSLIASHLGIGESDWYRAIVTAEQPDEELLNYIKSLHGKYKTAILSNANRGVVENRIGAQWIADCFDEVAVSADLSMVKPEPRIYEYVASKLGTAAHDCLFIDDKEVFLRPAEALGMKTVHYKDFKQARTEIEAALAADTED